MMHFNRLLVLILFILTIRSLSAQQIFDRSNTSKPKYLRSTTGTDTYVANPLNSLKSYDRGDCFTLDADTANTGVATINITSLGAKPILNRAGGALADNDITANKPIGICYDGTQFIIQGAGGTVTSVGLVGTANQLTVTGTSPITSSGSWTISVPTNPVLPGTVSATGFTTTGAAAGYINLTEGTACTPDANSVCLYAPADVTTAYGVIFPAASATGFILGTNASNINTLSFVSFTGTGDVVRASTPTITDQILGNSTEGTCNSGNRGKLTIVQGGAGVADTVRICVKNGADAYNWTSVI